MLRQVGSDFETQYGYRPWQTASAYPMANFQKLSKGGPFPQLKWRKRSQTNFRDNHMNFGKCSVCRRHIVPPNFQVKSDLKVKRAKRELVHVFNENSRSAQEQEGSRLYGRGQNQLSQDFHYAIPLIRIRISQCQGINALPDMRKKRLLFH